MSTRRIGILGGTFDPIHCGHLDVGRAAESALGLTEIVLIASNIPPHRAQPAASSHHRFAMVALAIVGREGWRASDLELRVGSPSFTTGTLQHFHDCGFAATELYFIIGADAFAEIESWKDFPAILDHAHFAVVSRPGFPASGMPGRLPALAGRMIGSPTTGSGDTRSETPSIFLIDAPTADVSATAIRRRSAAGQSIAGLVPVAVRQHIEQHALYSAASEQSGNEFGADAQRTPAAGRLHGQN